MQEGEKMTAANERDTEKRNPPGYSAKSLFIRVDFPTPEGPDRTTRRGVDIGGDAAAVEAKRAEADGKEKASRLSGVKQRVSRPADASCLYGAAK